VLGEKLSGRKLAVSCCERNLKLTVPILGLKIAV